MLAKLVQVDGDGSTLDADTLDGSDSAAFQRAGAAAGGDLTGAYPSPTVAANAITSAKVQDRSLHLPDVAAMSGQISVDVASVPAHACSVNSLTSTGRQAGDMLILEPSANLDPGIVVMPIFDGSSGDVFEFRVCNVTAAAIDPPMGLWGFAVFRQ
jgi:hypothetical protein